MIRKNMNISDDEFNKIIERFETTIQHYIDKNIINEYFAFYLAAGYNLDSIWSGNLSSHLNGALDYLGTPHFENNFDYSEINSILEKKYGLIITNATPLEIMSKKKEGQQFVEPFYKVD